MVTMCSAKDLRAAVKQLLKRTYPQILRARRLMEDAGFRGQVSLMTLTPVLHVHLCRCRCDLQVVAGTNAVWTAAVCRRIQCMWSQSGDPKQRLPAAVRGMVLRSAAGTDGGDRNLASPWVLLVCLHAASQEVGCVLTGLGMCSTARHRSSTSQLLCDSGEDSSQASQREWK